VEIYKRGLEETALEAGWNEKIMPQRWHEYVTELTVLSTKRCNPAREYSPNDECGA
jgi:hypothetical protein